MVSGIESFKKWFAGYGDQYAIIGGTACDLLMSEDGLDFRATRDIDMVLIVESLTHEFGVRLWEYIIAGGYEHKNKSTGEPQFYRFNAGVITDEEFAIFQNAGYMGLGQACSFASLAPSYPVRLLTWCTCRPRWRPRRSPA